MKTQKYRFFLAGEMYDVDMLNFIADRPYLTVFIRQIQKNSDKEVGIIERSDKGVLLQFTGKIDINGKEIFDGDILEMEDKAGNKSNVHVWYNETYAHWCFGGENGENQYFPTFKFKILGNIYQNPEIKNL